MQLAGTNWLTKSKTALKLVVCDQGRFWRALKRNLRHMVHPVRSGEVRVNGIRFQIDLDLDPAMQKMFDHEYQMGLVSLIKKYVGKGDVFIDVGANVGYISAVGLGQVGKAGEVHAFEPVPGYYERLKLIQQDNPQYRFHVNQLALGETEGTATIAVTNLDNIGWNTMVPDFMEKEKVREKITIRTARLDEYLSARKIKNVKLIKIDTEGYEFPVLKGLQRYLINTRTLPILIVEINPAAYAKLNTSLRQLSEFMSQLGYRARDLENTIEIDLTGLECITDVLFVPQKVQQL